MIVDSGQIWFQYFSVFCLQNLMEKSQWEVLGIVL